MKKVVLLEFIDEFESLRAHMRKRNLSFDDFTIVSLEPKVSALLKKEGISHENTVCYFTNNSHKKIILETEKIMKHIVDDFSFVDDNGLKSCYQKEIAHYVRVFSNHILKILEILENIYQKEKSTELYAFLSQGASESSLIDNDERYCGILTERFSQARNIAFFDINENKKTSPAPKNIRYRQSTAGRFFFRIISGLLKHKKTIIIPHPGSSFKKLMNAIYEQDQSVNFLAVTGTDNLLKTIYFNIRALFQRGSGGQPSYFMIKPAFSRNCSQREEKGLSDNLHNMVAESTSDIFRYNGVGYHDLIAQKTEKAWESHLLNMVASSWGLKKLFTRIPHSFVMSYIGLDTMAVAGELARKLGKKSLFISHGAHPKPVDSYHELELNNLCRTFMLGEYTHVALSTPVQEEHLNYFKNKYKGIDNIELKTGPLVFARVNKSKKRDYKIRLGVDPRMTVITHAVTTKARHSERFYFLETLDEFIQGLQDVVKAVSNLNNTVLAVRIHPGFYLSDDEMRSFLPTSGNYTIQRQGPFFDVLAATDILISYSSTAIDEALLNNIPVVLYDKWKRYNHFGINNESSGSIFPVSYVDEVTKLRKTLVAMSDNIQAMDNGQVDMSRYRYEEDYLNNFFQFAEEALTD